MKTRVRHLFGSLLVALLLSLLGINVVQAQTIVPDTDTQTVISSPNTHPQQFDITGGTRSGGNLFHSFQQFGLSEGQIANFLSQPTIQNILGRITGGNVSQINGLIQVIGGNSNLFLMNPAGIIFGSHARLNVPAAFVATTANGIRIGNGWFNAIGNNDYAALIGHPDSFAFLNHAGTILNAGVLTANPGQPITLLGGIVVNTGTISAPGGTITIAAVPGQRLVRITQEGSLLSLLLPTETANTINSPTSSPLSLTALLTGGGLPEATGITVENGIVRLTNSGTVISPEAGSATVSGTLSAASTTSPNPSQIQVFGDRVSLLNATLDASGINGGIVRIGGNYQGSGTLPNARLTEVNANSIVHADAIADVPGNGGSVVIWSTDTTWVAGTMTAQGGSQGGNGGLVETSSQHTLIISPTARVSTYAPQGRTGTWLLDPPELTVASDGTAMIAGDPLTNTPTTATTVSATAIVTGLNGNNVNLQASDRITVNAAIDASANPVAGDLTLTTPTTTLNQPIILAPGSILSGIAITVNVNPGTRIQNGVDVAASGGTVNVAAGTFYVPGVTNQVSITKPLTMQGAGAGNTIVDGGGNSRVFYIDPGAENTVNLDGLTIQNGYVASYIAGDDYVVENGAGILVNSGIVNLTNSTLSRNSSYEGNGGGIYNSGTANLSNTTVNNNSSSGGMNGGGGGIYNSGTANLSNTTVNNNSSSGGINSGGGGIYNSGTANLSNTTVNNNSSSGGINSGGGGIYNSGTANLSNTTVNNNSRYWGMDGGGGGIYNSGTANLFNTIINSNSAGIWGEGSGIYNSGTANLSNSTVNSNSTHWGGNGGNGGGIYNSGTANLSNSTVNSNSTYWDDGGGIYNSGIVNLFNSLVSSNSANGWHGGGGIYNGGVANITNSTVSGNLATNGGGIYNSGTVNLSNSTVDSNSVIYNSTIDSNSVIYNGGGIYNSGTANIINIYNGGGIYNSGTANIINSTVDSNSVIYNGGGIYNSGTVNLSNSTVDSNSVIYNGGGIYNSGTANIINSTVSSNSATNGGGIYNDGYTYTYYSIGFPEMGEPPFFGPYTFTAIGKAAITNSTLSSNLATGLGGGIYNRGTARVNSSTIANNSADSGGGVFNTSTAQIEDFLSQMRKFAGTFTVHNSIIAGNAASSGQELTNLGSSISEGYNLFGFNSSSGVEGMTLSDTDVVPSVAITYILAPLGNYGGLTQTHALLPGSPAIDIGDPSLTTPDQRGLTRVSRADIGAVEFRRADVDTFNLRVPVSSPLPATPLSATPLSAAALPTLPTFTFPSFNPEDLNQLSAALMGREIESMNISIQPMPTGAILCVDRSSNEEETPDLYQGIPDCPE